MPTTDPLERRLYVNEHARLRRHLAEALTDVRNALNELESTADGSGHQDVLANAAERLTTTTGRAAVAAGGLTALHAVAELVDDPEGE
ncbi:hypothetical protein [Nonomuraea sp. NPDC049141]|uniref:hypothetical protein n=1 Tax=Nonomuraea sp. NPDC049141 TaxID=3155500 RepID=UPI0033FB3733